VEVQNVEKPRKLRLKSTFNPYLHAGFRYSLALACWGKSWEETKNLTSGNGKMVADYTFAHWTRLLGSLGRKEKLLALFTETRGRVFDRGPLQQIINGTKEGLQLMFASPGRSYTCGSMALHNIATVLLGTNYTKFELAMLESPENGFTMEQLVKLASERKLNLVAVKLHPTNDLVIPSVVHWRENHYAAIVGKYQQWFQVRDPTFEKQIGITEESIRAESSGYFLVPQDAIPPGAKRITMAEARNIHGQGAAILYPTRQTPLAQPKELRQMDQATAVRERAGAAAECQSGGCPSQSPLFGWMMSRWVISRPEAPGSRFDSITKTARRRTCSARSIPVSSGIAMSFPSLMWSVTTREV
jgi:hypothetical protein